MDNFELLSTALSYLEEHLNERITTEDVARACFCSKSTLEKLFRCVNNISIHDYVIRRRMTKAAKALIADKERSILDIALEYGYNSNEAFTRAFKQVWHCKPSELRTQTRCPELYPRFLVDPSNNGEQRMKKVDISELYDLIKERRDCYFICCDIKHLVPINEISRTAGDIAILESLNRMNKVAGEEDMVFRIAGDEFVLLTDSSDLSYAEQLAAQLHNMNGTPILYENREIPLSLYIAISRLEEAESRSHTEMYQHFTNIINEFKKEAGYELFQ